MSLASPHVITGLRTAVCGLCLLFFELSLGDCSKKQGFGCITVDNNCCKRGDGHPTSKLIITLALINAKLIVKKNKVSHGQESPEENLLPLFVGVNYKQISIMLRKRPNMQLLVPVDYR